MRTIRLTKVLSVILCILLIATTAVMMFSCNKNSDATENTQTKNASDYEGYIDIGEGNTQIWFVVMPNDDEKIVYQVSTDEKVVGEALEKLELISGVESQYGLYVKTVCGITADYDIDGRYWAFYVNGEYSNYGVDSTEVKEGSEYLFKVST